MRQSCVRGPKRFARHALRTIRRDRWTFRLTDWNLRAFLWKRKNNTRTKNRVQLNVDDGVNVVSRFAVNGLKWEGQSCLWDPADKDYRNKVCCLVRQNTPTPTPGCVPSASVSRSAPVSICPFLLYLVWLSLIANQHIYFGSQEINGTENIRHMKIQ